VQLSTVNHFAKLAFESISSAFQLFFEFPNPGTQSLDFAVRTLDLGVFIVPLNF
jgi:hypothetical protein